MFRADLHCHSTKSDGVYSPVELIELAQQKGLLGLSITDHDTLTYCSSAYEKAKAAGIQMLLGVELSSKEPGCKESVHVLGYGFKKDCEQLHAHCNSVLHRRKKRNCEIAERLKTIGVHVDLDKLYTQHPTGAVGRPHFATEVVRQGKAKTIEEAFQQFLGDHKLCYAPMERFSVEEVIKVIHAAGGFAVLAHPHLIRQNKLLEALLRRPFDGIEGRYARMGPKRNSTFEKIAEERKWICTAGSDFHGYSQSPAQLGDSWVDQKVFEYLAQGKPICN